MDVNKTREIASARGTLTFKNTADRRAMLCLLAEQQAQLMRAMGESEKSISTQIVHDVVTPQLSKKRPVTASLIRSLQPDVRACLKAAKVKGWWLRDIVKDPDNCCFVKLSIVNYDPRKETTP